MHEGLFSRRLKCCRMGKSDNIWEGVISGWEHNARLETQLQFQGVRTEEVQQCICIYIFSQL